MEKEEEHKYDDIINLPHPVSKYRPQMPLSDRAAQFAPFAALTGHKEAVKETARYTESEQILSEDVIERLNEKLQKIVENIGAKRTVSITYFQPDDKKRGGEYLTHSGVVKKVDQYKNALIMMDKTVISIERIREIESDLFQEFYE